MLTGCRWLRQIPKAATVESKPFLFVCKRLRRGGGREILGISCALYRTRQTAGFPVAEDCTVRDGWQPEEMVHRRRWRNHNRSHQMTEGMWRSASGRIISTNRKVHRGKASRVDGRSRCCTNRGNPRSDCNERNSCQSFV